MKACSDVLRVADIAGGGRLALAWCPGCKRTHAWYLADDDGQTLNNYGPSHTWQWDGNLEAPTIEASLHVHPDPPPPAGGERVPGYRPQVRCHSFLRAGVWDFLSDCEHELVGQKVPMVPLPDWLCNHVQPCGAETRAGGTCTRRVKLGRYCWQHRPGGRWGE